MCVCHNTEDNSSGEREGGVCFSSVGKSAHAKNQNNDGHDMRLVLFGSLVIALLQPSAALSWVCRQHVGDMSPTSQNVAKFDSKCVSGPTQKLPRHKIFAVPHTRNVRTHKDPPPTTHTHNPNHAAPLLRCSAAPPHSCHCHTHPATAAAL